ncbi:MAG: sulfate transporter, partial [Cyclobacteriaceae bacterium]
KNRLIKNSLIQQIKNPEEPINYLLMPAYSASMYTLEDLKDNNLNEWSDKITLFNLEYSKNRVLKENAWLNNAVHSGKIGVTTAFLDRKTGAIQFSIPEASILS